MNMVLDAEEKFAYDTSISNFLMLKVWHDLGIDVTGFSNYFMHLGGYGDDPGSELLQDGFKSLFPDFRHLDYDELKELTAIANEVDMHPPESLYILNNEKLQKLIESGKDKELMQVKSKHHGDLLDFEMAYHQKYGILIGLHFEGILHEVAVAISEVLQTIDRLYKQVEEVELNGLYNQAV
ncbi:hypothetical protein D1B31_17995 [Neobacillus notoginsengisoli]|uniref:Uncharacterized protein n=1 Tax=Neobacillus notoginsengisoli TaxID=1578198 RepID=A0A417YQG2_9BACI|nr:hypothetical protein [Neobacillus notoginsengisoli]RHW35981.1 hypothetical protein D1B31_17995 [Neobacillus notoginsengisoli]